MKNEIDILQRLDNHEERLLFIEQFFKSSNQEEIDAYLNSERFKIWTKLFFE